MKKKVIVVFLVSTLLSGCRTANKVKDHIHTYGSDWFSSSEGHFRKCIYDGCTAFSKVNPHTYNEEGICTVCGFDADDETNTGCEHDWTSWEVIEEPTCVDTGVRERECKKCGKYQTRSIDIDTVQGHYWVPDPSGDREATCTERGIEGSMYCQICYLKKKGNEVAPIEHNYQVKSHALSKEVTCTEPGLHYEECTVCDANRFVEIPATGHNFISTYQGAPSGYTNISDEYCTKCSKRVVQWNANDVDDTCKNEKRLEDSYHHDIVDGYEPNYVENSDGSVRFWGRAIHNAAVIPDSNTAGDWTPESIAPKYDASVAGSFFEYKLKIDAEMLNVKLMADIDIAPYSTNLFTAETDSWTPGLIDSDTNRYKTRYVISLDGIELEQDLSRDVNFGNLGADPNIRDWFTFPIKDTLNLSTGTHTLRISMGSGYKSNFYQFKFENQN